MTARPDDWVIRGVQGEFYPCKPDIFAATYEEEDLLITTGVIIGIIQGAVLQDVVLQGVREAYPLLKMAYDLSEITATPPMVVMIAGVLATELLDGKV